MKHTSGKSAASDALETVGSLKSLNKSLGSLDAEVAANLVSAATDIALVLDRNGVIEDYSCANDDLPFDDMASWRGRRWTEIVTVESRPKVEELLRDAAAKLPPRGRQVNHPSHSGADVPVRYSALRVSQRGKVLALGCELRSMATLQRKLVDAQQSMEREYARLRHAETRYRLLFRLAREAVMVVDVATLKVVEANPAAAILFGKDAKKLVGRAFVGLFDVASAPALQSLIGAVKVSGRSDDCHAKLGDVTTDVTVSASLFRHENSAHVLMRLAPIEALDTPRTDAVADSRLAMIMERMPDAFVVTGLDQTILTANSAFLDLAQLAREEQARGQEIGRWLGRSGVDVDLLIASLRSHGSVRHFSTVFRGELGSTEIVEVSAVAVLSGEQPCYGLTIRGVARQPHHDAAS
ncbi:MAG: transcriptional regulator PpsR, partial [Pirellulaceae bacterium]